MIDADLAKHLESIGLTGETARLVALLPLVQVAWADGAVQPEEKSLILEIAKKRSFADDAGIAVIERWLTTEPSRFVYATGRKVVGILLARKPTQLPNLDQATPADVIAWCEGVSEVAGGFFGWNKVHSAETAAIAEIAEALKVKQPKSWAAVKGDFGR